MRPLRFSFARSSSPSRSRPAATSSICSAMISRQVGEVLLARAHVDADQAGVRVLRGEAVDRVRHPALLADLLEEPRRGRAAEDRVEQRGGEAAAVGARDPGRADADVVLLGVLAREAEAGRRRRHEQGPRRAAGCRRRRRRGLGAPEQREQLSCSRFPAAAITMLRPTYISPWYRRSRRGSTRRDHLRRADHGPAERVVAEDRLGEEVVDELLRRVLVHRDLLEHDLPLGVELGERGREDHVGHHVERASRGARRARGRRPRVLPRGGRVQLAAEAVEDLRDLLRRVRGASP